MDDDVTSWTAKRKTTLVMDIVEGKTTVAEASGAFDLTPAMERKLAARRPEIWPLTNVTNTRHHSA